MNLRRLIGHTWRRAVGSPADKRHAALFFAERLSHRHGFSIYSAHTTWAEDDSFIAVMKRFDASYKRPGERQYALYQLARAAAHLPGDTAEIGVYRGRGSYIIMAATQDGTADRPPRRTHHMFNSFEGLSAPRQSDQPGHPAVDRTWQKGDLAASIEEVERALAAYSSKKFYKGWVPDRFPEVADRRFCFVQIDVDLYEPTLATARFFLPLLVPGGLLVCDDYGVGSTPGARRAMDEVAAAHGQFVAHLPTGQGVVIAQASPEA